MPIKIASISETWSKDVFSDRGLYIGRVEDIECDLRRFKLRSVIVKAMKGSYLNTMLGSKKGLIIPFPMVQAIGDIIIIKHISSPSVDEDVGTEEPVEQPAE